MKLLLSILNYEVIVMGKQHKHFYGND